MDGSTNVAKLALLDYLRESRHAVVSKLDGLSEHDRRRPMTGTGTNLLGLVKHLAGVEIGYLGECLGRPPEHPLPWHADGSVWDGADMWATEDESTDYIVGLYRDAWQRSDRNVEELDLDAPATVPWWAEGERETDMGTLLVRMLTDTARHAGQADIIREQIDGRGGSDQDSFGDEAVWRAYVARIEKAAAAFPA
jgi:uncharacterized damage-inducible protein DinB